MPLIWGVLGGVRRCSMLRAVQSLSNSCSPVAGRLRRPKKAIRERFALVGENGADAHRAGPLQITQEAPGVGRRPGLEDADKDPGRGAVDCDEEVAAPVLVGHLRQLCPRLAIKMNGHSPSLLRFPQNRSCHEQRKSTRKNMIIRNGTASQRIRGCGSMNGRIRPSGHLDFALQKTQTNRGFTYRLSLVLYSYNTA